MSDSLTDLILSLTPEDGSSIGNGAMMALLREQVPGLADADYVAARDALVADGLLTRGRGRGGSIMRVLADAEDEDAGASDPEGDDEADGFALIPTDAPAPRAASGRTQAAARRPAAAAQSPMQVLSYRHGETRMNNPEVGMVHAGTDPDGDKTTWAYDPHLDPVLNFDNARAGIETLIDDALASDDAERMRAALHELKRLQAPYLNWTGKAERTSVEVETVSLHVHERVDPATILANAAKRLKGKDAATQWRQPDLFAAPFENLPLRQALDFYHHEKGWSNRLVAGDSLLVMNSLLTKESLGGQVQMIYIDPPYGIKYGSNFQPFTNKRDVKDRSDADLTQEPEMIKAFRDTWELGIHSYLTYLRDRLLLARELMSESGSMFVQIGEENCHLVRDLLDEVFGMENFVSQIIFTKTSSATSENLSGTYDLILFYAKDKPNLKFRQPYILKEVGGTGGAAYKKVRLPNLAERPILKEELNDPQKLEDDARVFRIDNLTSQGAGRDKGEGAASWFPVNFQGATLRPSEKVRWKTNELGMERLLKAGRLSATSSGLYYVRYFDDFAAFKEDNMWADTGIAGFASEKRYVVETSEKVVERCMIMATDPGDLVLDPTCGSGTTAAVAEKWGRRWISCDTSRVAITLAKQRLMTASFDYYALCYPHEGLKGGFDYHTVPHIMLKNIVTNPDIDTIYAEEHPKIAAA
ncbi:MAG: site-specific DNA-methyltransferase, partial [Halochromatium sp.]